MPRPDLQSILLLLLAAPATVFLCAACGGDDRANGAGTAGSQKITAADRQEAETLFGMLCATCHGTKGTGDGPGAGALDPKPRNYTDKKWQASVTDEELRKIIVYGGAAVGKSAMMPASPQLRDKPGVVDALVQKIRSFGR